ncbi:hypothetical protein LV164_002722 [Aspergillus fumigatus]|nr:hypothetical protein LV157_006989 [Aspergillus fumigatus]KAJ8211945.1 hypothetical protein LV164_002722 [Aspergillus fumigatus]
MTSSVDAKLLKQTKFPPEFNRKVDMKKVNIEVMKKWIAGKISEILGNEDDVVIELCFNLLEGSRFPDIKSLQIQLTGFLDKDTPKFCKDLWSLCLSAQENPQGVPKELLEAKKLELIQEKIAAEKAAEEARRKREQELARERELEEIRRRERFDRNRGRRGGGPASDFAIRPQDENLILTFPLVRAGAVGLQDRPVPLPPALVPFPHLDRHPVDAYLAETDTNVAAPSRRPDEKNSRRRGSSPDTSRTDKNEPTADSAKARKSRDDRRLSRSRDRDDERRRRRSTRSVSRSRSRSRGRSRTGSVSPRRASRSRSRSYGRERKRRRSIERYAPAARRRRNTSSVSTHTEKRQRMADPAEESAKRSSPPPEQPSSTDHDTKDTEEGIHSKPNRPRISSTELREKLLRERLVAMRRTASHDKVGGNTTASKQHTVGT